MLNSSGIQNVERLKTIATGLTSMVGGFPLLCVEQILRMSVITGLVEEQVGVLKSTL
jgi:hypothetical protein